MRLFAHRGFVTESHPENTVASLENAVACGFKAIEFDIWSVEEKLVLKHDRPRDKEIEILPALKEYFAHKNELYYWLDFKNLNEENCTKALMLVKNCIEEFDIKLDRVYFVPLIIEMDKAEKIFAKIRNIFGPKVKIGAFCKELRNEQEARDLRKFLDKNNLKLLSIFHQLLSKNSLQALSGIEIFAWTVNDLSRMEELVKLGVTNFATDKITPQNYESRHLKSAFGSPQTR